MSLKILVTQSSFKHSLGVIRHLSKQGHSLYGSVDKTIGQYIVARCSRFPKSIYFINQTDCEFFTKELLELQKKHRFDAILPIGFPVTEFVSQKADFLLSKLRFVATPYQQLKISEDKLAVARIAESLYVPAPTTYQVEDINQLANIAESLPYPIVLKSRSESAKGMVDYAQNSDELIRKYHLMCNKFQLTSSDKLPILQEYIPGYGCGFFALYDHGEIKRIFMHRRIREYPISGGPSCCAESFYDKGLQDTGQRLLDGMKWHGIAMVECRYDNRDGLFKVIEINPKFWGSLELALAAGADFANDYVQLALGAKLTFNNSYQHIRYQWPLDGDILHAIKKPTARKSVIMDLFNPKVYKNIYLTDPLVVVAKILLMLYQFFRKEP